MQIRRRALPAASLALTAWLSAGYADASSHREAPVITEHAEGRRHRLLHVPQLRGRAGTAIVTLIANYLPLQDPYGGPNYFTLDPDARLRDPRSTTTATRRRTSPSSSASTDSASGHQRLPVGGEKVVGAADQRRPDRRSRGDPNDTGNLNV